MKTYKTEKLFMYFFFVGANGAF